MHITGNDGMLRADNDAGWLQPNLGAVGAVVALGGSMRIGVDIERIVGAGLHTGLAADTAAGVEIDDAISPLVQSSGRTDSNARSIIAVIAAVDEKITARVGKLPLLDVLDPRPVDADGNVVFSFTGDCTGMATDTLALVDHKGVFGHQCFPLVVQQKPLARCLCCTDRKIGVFLVSVRKKWSFV